MSRKWTLRKRWCPLCRLDKWVITDPQGMQRGCFKRHDVALRGLTQWQWGKPA